MERTFHKWQPSDSTAFVTVATVADNAMSPESYESRYYDGNNALSFIDEATAEDGTVRKSYRITDDDQIANGQLDVFYVQRGQMLAVVELYTADNSKPNEATISRLQLILDSFQLTTQ